MLKNDLKTVDTQPVSYKLPIITDKNEQIRKRQSKIEISRLESNHGSFSNIASVSSFRSSHL